MGMPAENKAGDALDKSIIESLQKSMNVPKLYEHMVKPKVEPPDQIFVEEPKKLSILCFTDQGGMAKAILDSAPDGRIGNRKFIDNTYELDIDEMRELMGKKGTWDIIIFGCGLEVPDSNAVADVVKTNEDMTRAFFHFCKAACRNDPKRCAVLTRGVFDEDPKVHKKHGLKITVAGNLFGHCNTARQELEDTDI